jgi:sarcosine oxidase subunit gamma
VAEHRLAPRTPLGLAEPARDRVGALTVEEHWATAMATLAPRRGRDAEVAAAARDWGVELPGPGRAQWSGGRGAMWLGPALWLMEAPLADSPDLAAELAARFGDAAAITEQTDAWARFDLAGPDLPRLLERLSMLDLATAGPGFASRTVVEHIGCLIQCRAAGRVSLLCGRSFAASLHHAVLTAARTVAGAAG